MIGLQSWTSFLIIDDLGQFGWFYGDFFFAPLPQADSNSSHSSNSNSLTYTGIYRYLNNPELIFGQAAYWGVALIVADWRMTLLAAFAFLTNYLFLQWVEAPHLKRLYGERVRTDSGVTKVVNNAIDSLVPDSVKASVKSIVPRIPDVEPAVNRIVDDVKGNISDIKELIIKKIDQRMPQILTVREKIISVGGSLSVTLVKKESLSGTIRFYHTETSKLHGHVHVTVVRDSSVTISPLEIPWFAGTFRLIMFDHLKPVGKSNVFTIASAMHTIDCPLTLALIRHQMTELLMQSLHPTTPIDDYLRRCLHDHHHHLLFKRISEVVRCWYGVDLAPATIAQFAMDPDLLFGRILAAHDVLHHK